MKLIISALFGVLLLALSSCSDPVADLEDDRKATETEITSLQETMAGLERQAVLYERQKRDFVLKAQRMAQAEGRRQVGAFFNYVSGSLTGNLSSSDVLDTVDAANASGRFPPELENELNDLKEDSAANDAAISKTSIAIKKQKLRLRAIEKKLKELTK